jgi:hypothetical protein
MNAMKRFCAAVAIVIGWSGVSVVHAAPPTVTPSPGYDARLQEQRAASATIHQPAIPVPRPIPRHRRHRH